MPCFFAQNPYNKMMESISLKHIKKLMPPAVYAQAEDLYKNNQIQVTGHHQNEYTAKVSGEGLYPHEVHLRFTKNFQQIFFSCDCASRAVNRICSHIGALLIWIHHNQNEEDPFSLIKKLNKKTAASTQDFVLDKQNKGEAYLFFRNFLETQDKEAKKAAENKKTEVKLLFCLHKEEKKLYLYPALGILNEQGEIDRLENYSPRRGKQNFNAEEKHFLQAILASSTFYAPALGLVPLLGRKPEICLFDPQSKKTVSFVRLAQLDISFLPYFRDDQLLFKPAVSLFSGRGKGLHYLKMEKLGDLENTPLLYWEKKDNTLFYFDDQAALETAAFIKNYHAQYTLEKICALRDFFKEKNKAINIDFDLEKIVLSHEKPQTILDISSLGPEELQLRLLFLYGSREISPQQEDEYLYENAGSRSLIIYQRMEDYEQSMGLAVRQVFKDDKGASLEMEGDKAFSVKLDISLYFFFLVYGEKFMQQGIRLLINKKSIKRQARISISVERKKNSLEMETHVQEQGKSTPFKLDQQLLKQGIIQSDENYILLSPNQKEKLEMLLRQGMGKQGKLETSAQNYLLLDELKDELQEKDREALKTELEIARMLREIKGLYQEEAADNFQGQLRSYQKSGLGWLWFLNQHQLGGCLADDMGLGKTIQTLALLQKLKQEGKLKQVLLVAPVVTLSNWLNEISRFTPELSVYHHAGQDRPKQAAQLPPSDIIILSYHIMRNDVELLAQLEYSYIILDESQNIKNRKTKTYQALMQLKGAFRLALTGTPVENNLMELWSLMNFLNPGLLGKQGQFKRNYYNAAEDENSHVLGELRRLIFPYILRRKKGDVLSELPEKEVLVHYVEMDPQQKKLYEQKKSLSRQRLQQEWKDGPGGKNSLLIIELLLILRQMSLFPDLVSSDYADIPSAKMEALELLLEDILAEGHKVLIFSQFEQVLLRIKGFLEEKKLDYSFISGKTKKRQEEIDSFQKDPDRRIFLITLKAGGVGINLTAADYVILFDPWWNPAAEQQAIDRSHRFGQKNKVIAYKLIARDSIEEKILQLQQKKLKLVEDVITSDSGLLKELNKEEIFSLFS